MPLIAKLSGTDARITGSEFEDFVYVLIEALEAIGFSVELRATRIANAGGTGGAVLVTGGHPKAIKRLTDEMERIAGVVPVLSDATGSTLVTLSSTGRTG